MKPKHPFISFVCWTIFIFALLVVTSLIEHKVSMAVGSHLSSDYAQWTADWRKSKDAFRAKDPEHWQHVIRCVAFSAYAVYGLTAAIIAGMTVWRRTESRGVPNESAMNQTHQTRNSWNHILFGIAMVFCGVLSCLSGITALNGHTMVPGNWKYPPMSGENALVCGLMFVAGGYIWLWSCYRKQR